jgi:CBS domain-containing protein
MQARNIMTTSVHTCTDSETLDRAVQRMWDHDVGALPVLDHRNRPIAMITDRDAVMAAYFSGLPLRDVPVRTAMSKSLVACRPEMGVEEIEYLMQSNRIRRIPVVSPSGELLGIIGLADLARAGAADERWASTLPKTVTEILEPRAA